MNKLHLPTAYVLVRRHAFAHALAHATGTALAEARILAVNFEAALRRAGHPLARPVKARAASV